jgi:hypothetical protein
MSKNPPSVSPLLYAKNQAGPRRRSMFADWSRYEALKAFWIGQHPDSTPAQYETAIRSIAKSCGV